MKIMNKLKENDLYVKLLSLVMAIFLWSFVMGIVNPEIPITYRGVPVTVEGEDYLSREGMSVISPTNPRINVEVIGPKSDLSNINSNNIIATMDLNGLEPGENNVNVSVSIQGQSGRARVVSVEPSTITVNLDTMVSENLKVEVDILGELPEGYTLGNVRPTSNYVRITAPSLIKDQIERVVSYVDVSGKTETYVATSAPVFLDKNGLEVSNIETGVESLQIEVPIYKLKSVPINIETQGTVNENDQIENIRIVPENIIIRGSTENIDNIDSVSTNPINLGELTESGKHRVSLNLPEGISLNDSEDIFIEYDYISNVEATYEIPSSNIQILNTNDNYSYTISENQPITVTLFGESSLLDSIEDGDINLNINAQNIEPGESSQNINVSPIENVSIRGVNPQSINLVVEETQGAEVEETDNSNTDENVEESEEQTEGNE